MTGMSVSIVSGGVAGAPGTSDRSRTPKTPAAGQTTTRTATAGATGDTRPRAPDWKDAAEFIDTHNRDRATATLPPGLGPHSRIGVVGEVFFGNVEEPVALGLTRSNPVRMGRAIHTAGGARARASGGANTPYFAISGSRPALSDGSGGGGMGSRTPTAPMPSVRLLSSGNRAAEGDRYSCVPK